MSNDISTILKEATKDLLSEETLKVISEAIEQKAAERAQLTVEAALVKQDNEYAEKLQQVLEAIDADHTEKLDKIVSRIDEVHSAKFKQALNLLDESHSAKLTKIVKLYEEALVTDSKVFKNNLVEQLSNYIDLYIDKVIPVKQIQEATENTRSRKIVNEIKRMVSLSDVFVNENIREALLDGKRQIDEANSSIVNLQKANKLIVEKAQNLEKSLFLEKKVENFPVAKKDYMIRVLSEKSLESIKENFNYVAEMFDKKDLDNMETLKENMEPKTKGVDVVQPEGEVITESKGFTSAGDNGEEFVKKAYVSEFTKKMY